MTAQPKQLPANPNITHLKNQAKDLKKAVTESDPEAIARATGFHPAISKDPSLFDPGAFTLRDAQATLAREYGFEGWHQLNTEVGERMVDERDLHRWFGVQLNNGMWDNIESADVGPGSPLEDREMMLYSAYASAYHWRHVGNHANYARGEHLISRMAIKIGETELALRHARRCLEFMAAYPEDMEDWDAPFGHEAIARALAAGGDTTGGREHLTMAEQLTAAVADPADREVLEAELTREPWFGLR